MMKRQKITVVIIRKGIISMKVVRSTVKGDAMRTIPSMRVRFVRLEPMIPPIASCILPRLTGGEVKGKFGERCADGYYFCSDEN